MADAKVRQHGGDDGHVSLFYHRAKGSGVRVVLVRKSIYKCISLTLLSILEVDHSTNYPYNIGKFLSLRMQGSNTEKWSLSQGSLVDAYW